jgi:hypothetical protein
MPKKTLLKKSVGRVRKQRQETGSGLIKQPEKSGIHQAYVMPTKD